MSAPLLAPRYLIVTRLNLLQRGWRSELEVFVAGGSPWAKRHRHRSRLRGLLRQCDVRTVMLRRQTTPAPIPSRHPIGPVGARASFRAARCTLATVVAGTSVLRSMLPLERRRFANHEELRLSDPLFDQSRQCSQRPTCVNDVIDGCYTHASTPLVPTVGTIG